MNEETVSKETRLDPPMANALAKGSEGRQWWPKRGQSNSNGHWYLEPSDHLWWQNAPALQIQYQMVGNYLSKSGTQKSGFCQENWENTAILRVSLPGFNISTPSSCRRPCLGLATFDLAAAGPTGGQPTRPSRPVSNTYSWWNQSPLMTWLWVKIKELPSNMDR